MLGDVQQLGQDTAKLADAPLWALDDDEVTACVQAAHRVEQAVAVLQARLVRQAIIRGQPRAAGHRSAIGWLRATLNVDTYPARQLAQRAEALDRRPDVAQALLDGRLDARQAAEIIAAVHDVSEGLAEFDDIEPADAGRIVRDAETTMLDMGRRLSALQLRAVGERILAHVAPELADRAEAAALARQEARAHRRRGFSMSAPEDGVVRLFGQLGVEDAAILNAALQPLCAPLPEDSRTAAQRRADALIDVCRLALRTAELPDTGGEPAQVAVKVSYDPLTQALGVGTTDTGDRLSAEAVRRMACDAKILPVVLGGAGQILDVGRSHRLATAPIRRALAIRDGGCAFPDCDRPPRWTDAHHIVAWTAGGPTSLDNLVLLCRHHHRLIHDSAIGWQIRLGTDGRPDFIPPADIDPDRRPRRNLYHPQS